MPNALYADLGKISYSGLVEIGEALASMRHDEKIQDIIIFAEHEPALLAGADAEKVEESGLPVHKDAGCSGVTYIGPGQLSVYPVHDYTRLMAPGDAASHDGLVQNVIDTVSGVFGVPDGAVIHAKNIRLGNRVASGGFHLNVDRQSTKHGNAIDRRAISIEEATGYGPHIDEVKSAVLTAMKKHFGYGRIEQCEIVRSGDGISVKK